MTTDDAQRSVLLIGKSQLVLNESVVGLRALDYKAEATNDSTDLTGRFDVKEIDLVVFGGQVPPDRKAELREEIGAINPGIIFVQGLAGIPGLIINQVEGAFSANRRDPTRAPTYMSDDRSIQLNLADTADVEVTAWWQKSFVPPDPRSDSLLRPSEGGLRHGEDRRGDLRFQHRHRAMTMSQVRGSAERRKSRARGHRSCKVPANRSLFFGRKSSHGFSLVC
jgi:hypothetical protein